MRLTRTRRRWSRARDEQGAVAVFTAVLVSTVLVGAASFTLDIGFQRMARRDMQAIADMVAMDMARKLDGRPTAALLGTAWNGAVGTSLGAQGETVGDDLTVRSCSEAEVGAEDASLSAPGICAYPGVLNADGTFSGSGSAAATHVKVLTRTSVDYFLPVYATSGAAGRSAVAKAETSACFRLGSFAARIDASGSVLGPVLDDALGVNLDVLSYKGLAAGDIRLLDLATQLGLGSVDELATAKVTLGALLNATAAVLTRESGDPDAAASLSVLQSLNAAAGVGTVVDLGRLFSLSDSTTSAKEAQVNVLDLVAGAAFVANGANALAIPLTVNLPGITGVSAKLYVVEPPRLACGPVGTARAQSAQIRIVVSGRITTMDIGLVKANVDFQMNLEVARADGLLVDAVCGDGTSPSPYGIDVEVASGLAQLGLTLEAKTVGLLDILLKKVDANLKVGVTAGGGSELAQVRVPPQDFETPVETGSGSIGLGGLPVTVVSKTQWDLLTSVTTVINNLTSQVVSPLVSALDTQVLAPLTEAFGINLSGADVYMSRPEPDCATPALRG